jgi:hypothetical protein
MLSQLARSGGPTSDLRYLLSLDQIKGLSWFEALLNHGSRSADQCRDEHHGESADPEERHGRIDAVVRG